MKIKTYPLLQSTILRLYAERDELDLSPEYQRNGDIWSLKKRQLLIDSILNGFDIPKLYFHVVDVNAGKYAVIDGRQRLEAIFKFVEGEFGLAEDFEYFSDPSVKISGLTYLQIAEKYQKIKIRFDSTSLPVVLVETEDEELIDDMFSRLNEAAPLNAAEKRNAFGGPVVQAITNLSDIRFFKRKVKFTNKRYQHREVAARLLFLEHSIRLGNKIVDTKKEYLDEFAKGRDKERQFDQAIGQEVSKTLHEMEHVFTDQDPLLRSQAILPIYYLLFREAKHQKKLPIGRDSLVNFKEALDNNRRLAENDIATADYEMLEFDRLSQQGTNDASSIEKRLQTLATKMGLAKSEISYV